MKLILTPEEVQAEVGGPDMYRRMLKAGWLEPVEKGSRFTRYSGLDVQKACLRYINRDPLEK